MPKYSKRKEYFVSIMLFPPPPLMTYERICTTYEHKVNKKLPMGQYNQLNDMPMYYLNIIDAT